MSRVKFSQLKTEETAEGLFLVGTKIITDDVTGIETTEDVKVPISKVSSPVKHLVYRIGDAPLLRNGKKTTRSIANGTDFQLDELIGYEIVQLWRWGTIISPEQDGYYFNQKTGKLIVDNGLTNCNLYIIAMKPETDFNPQTGFPLQFPYQFPS